MILSRTPYRVSFFGGGTDYPAWYEKRGGAVLVSAIDKFCWVTMRYQPQFFEHISRVCWTKVELVSNNLEIENPAVRAVLEYFNKPSVGFEIHHQGDLPARSGMGSSSSFIVGILNAHWELTHGNCHTDAMALAKTAVRIERDYVGDTVGCQDQYAAALGGVHLLDIQRTGEINAYGVWPDAVRELESRLLLVFLGSTRHASEIAKVQVAEIGNHELAMAQMAEQAWLGYQILTKQAPMSDFPLLLNAAWKLKRSLSPVISNPEIDRVIDGLLANGASATKLIGAGSGGFVLIYVEPKNRSGVIEWSESQKLTPVPFKFSDSGSEIVYRESAKAERYCR